MPLSIYHAIRKSENPDEYLDLLIHAVENNSWVYPKPTPEETQELWSSSGVKPLAFKGRKRGNKVSVHIDRIELKEPEAIKKCGKSLLEPRLRVCQKVIVRLNEDDWRHAASITRTVKDAHPASDGLGSTTHALLFPAGIFSHWQKGQTLSFTHGKDYDGLTVLADDEKIDALRKYERVASVVRGYLGTVNFLRKPDQESAYESKIGIKKIRRIQALKNLSGIDRFLVANKEHHAFFEELARISAKNTREEKRVKPQEKKMLKLLTTRRVSRKAGTDKKIRESMKAAIKKAITTHFSVPKNQFVGLLARDIAVFFENPDAKLYARKIIEKSRSPRVQEGIRLLEERRRR